MNRFQVRRATVEDLPQLRELWEAEALPGEVLEKRVAEFQVVDDGAGQLLAALGLEMVEGHGRLHSEAIVLLEQAETMRGLLWPRFETMARNQGLVRLWTALEAPFWKGVGFKKVNEETLALLPGAFAREGATWLTMPLRAVAAGPDDLDKQFAVLKAMSQAEHEQLLERAKMMKVIALALLGVVFGGFALWVLYWMKVRSRLRKRQVE